MPEATRNRIICEPTRHFTVAYPKPVLYSHKTKERADHHGPVCVVDSGELGQGSQRVCWRRRRSGIGGVQAADERHCPGAMGGGWHGEGTQEGRARRAFPPSGAPYSRDVSVPA